jgi:glycosyltransferase involved in cell wall biosynthesis
MRIMIDLQAAQAPKSRSCGIGHNSISLALAMVRNRGEHEILIALNGLLPDAIESIRTAFDGLLPQENIRVWSAVGPVASIDSANNWRRQSAEFVREAFLASLRPDVVHVSSLFEGYADDAVTSIGALSRTIPTAVTLFEQIPYVHQKSDPQSSVVAAWYQAKIEHLRRAGLWLAISESSRREGIDHLGLPDGRLVNISSDADAHFRPLAIATETVRALRKKFGFENIQSKKLSCDESARRAIAALERLHAEHQAMFQPKDEGERRPRLAYVSPLPPVKSGIADYSADLLPALARHYEIDVIVEQDEISDPWVKANFPARSAQWFKENASRYERVLYHFGNNVFHVHMFDLLKSIPGVVVLHDFFLSNLAYEMDCSGIAPGYWTQELYKGQGYPALSERYHAKDVHDLHDVVWKYPCSLSVVQDSLGVIVHSPNSVRLAQRWYGGELSDWAVIPLLRATDTSLEKELARKVLGIGTGDFLVCAFGLLGPNKLNHRLAQAWLKSRFAHDKACQLVFVGENHPQEYGQELLATIRANESNGNIRITGWTQQDTYRQYLAAADVGVQLRGLSRGETSAAVLDCMNYGLPVIVNANGSMADLDDEAVWKLPDEFSDEQLIEALETLWRDDVRRRRMGERARHIVLRDHNPRICAERYGDAIERFYRSAAAGLPALPHAIAGIDAPPPGDIDLILLSDVIAETFPVRNRQRQLLVDVSAMVDTDLRTGIQRVVRSILKEWLENPPSGYRVEPVYATDDRTYRYARRFTLEFLGCPDHVLEDEPLNHGPGDVLLMLDFNHPLPILHENYLTAIHRAGTQIIFVIYDLLPIQFPDCWEPRHRIVERHQRWLEVATKYDGAVCISKTVASELAAWVKETAPVRQRPFMINWFHLGADVDNSAPTRGLPADAHIILKTLRSRASFLMVGTLEPRKAHVQVLEAFDQLWQSGADVNLVIVGRLGWGVDSLIDRLRSHPEMHKRLFWLEGISDEFLEIVYAASTSLIAASYGEGFGLPLIEAAQHKLPVIARDIPVFREVAGEHAYYFDAASPDDLAQAIKAWLALLETGRHPRSDNMQWLTWKESAAQLLRAVLFNPHDGDTLETHHDFRKEDSLLPNVALTTPT